MTGKVTGSIKRGEYVRVSGIKYGSYDGEIGRVYGDLAPVKGEPAYCVDVGGMAITVLQKDLTVVENPKARKIKRFEVEL